MSADRLTAARLPALEADALPAFLSLASTARSPVAKRRAWSRKELRERARDAEIRRLVEDLTCTANPTGHVGELRRAVEERLDRAHHDDLLRVLEQRMPYAAQNIVLERLPQSVRSDDAAHDLLRRLLAVDFQMTPAPEEKLLGPLHARRTAGMTCWFFRWLVQPRAAAHAEAVARFLGGLASDQGETARLVLEELQVDASHDRIPELPAVAWLAVVRGLYERRGASPSTAAPGF